MKKTATQAKNPHPQADIFKIIKIRLQLTSNYKIMPRPKGSKNRVTTEVKEQFYTFNYEPEVNSPQVFAGVTST